MYETKNRRRDGGITKTKWTYITITIVLLISLWFIGELCVCVRACVCVCVCMCGCKSVIGQTWNFSDDARPHGTRRDRLGEWGERPHRAAVSGFLTCSAGRVIVTSHAGAKHAGGGFSRKRARSDVANVLLLRSPPPTPPPPPPPPLSTMKHIFCNA